jgi:hypothetical protein
MNTLVVPITARQKSVSSNFTSLKFECLGQ